jgi:hypothetical protein
LCFFLLLPPGLGGGWGGGGAPVDNVREQKKLKARKMLEKAQNPHPSSARFVSRLWIEKPLSIL